MHTFEVDTSFDGEPVAITPQGIHFRNLHSQMIFVYWQNPTGEDVLMVEIEPFQSAEISSYPGHIFYPKFEDEDDQVGLFQVTIKENQNDYVFSPHSDSPLRMKEVSTHKENIKNKTTNCK